MSHVTVRPFDPKLDTGFIYSTWPKAVYYAGINPIDVTKDEWFNDFYNYMKGKIAASSVYIACIQDSSDTILGYSIVDENKVLQVVYVKELFRRQGIARALTQNKHIKSVNLVILTRIGSAILEMHPDAFKEESKKKEEIPNEPTCS